VLDAEAFWQTPCDILVPAALEGQLDAGRARKLACRLVVEGANGPTTPEADDVLRERSIAVVPDVLANAGGVTVSYFEWVQDFSSFFWSEADVNANLERIMGEAFRAVWDLHLERRIALRTAAYVIGCTRVLQAHAGDTAQFALHVPIDTVLMNLHLSLQGLCTGAPGPQLSNALDEILSLP